MDRYRKIAYLFLMQTGWVPFAVCFLIQSIHYFFMLPFVFSIAGATVALVALWSSDWNYEEFGIKRVRLFRLLAYGLITSVWMFLIFDVIIHPFLELWLGKIDDSAYRSLEGNLVWYLTTNTKLLFFTSICSIFASMGYVANRIYVLFGSNMRSAILGVVTVSTAIGVMLWRLDPTSAAFVFFIHLFFGFVFFVSGRNLILVSIVSFFYNLVALTLIYLGMHHVLTDFVTSLF